MAYQKTYGERAEVYEEQAKQVTDRWFKERLLALAKHCREMADQEERNR